MKELLEWLDRNKIQYLQIDEEVLEIIDFGKVFYEDTSKMNSIFRQSDNGECVFNTVEDLEVLMEEDINYIVFQFGNNWYYTDLRQSFTLNILKYIGLRQKPKCDIKYVNLGVHSPFELLNGSFSLKSWVNKAKYLGHEAIGVCDHNTMAATYTLQKECESVGIKPIFGYSLDFVDTNGNKIGAKVYVQTQEGLQHLLRIQKTINVDSDDKTISINKLTDYGDGNVLVLDKYSSYWIKDNIGSVIWLQTAFDNVFYQIDLSEYKAERIDIKVLEATKYYFDNIYEKYPEDMYVEPVLITDCYYLDQDDAKNKIILNKINAGAAHEQSNDQYFKDIDDQYEKFIQLFDENRWDIDSLFKKCCDNTLLIAESADARFATDRNFMPKYDMTPAEIKKYGTTHNMFNQLLEEGFQKLVPPDKADAYREQMEYEKYIIESTNNVDYLLVQYDTVNWCRENNILVGCGRGSAAGSLLLYLLGITLVDPIRFDLIFERFLLPERAGLYQSDSTIIAEDVISQKYVEVKLETGKTLKIDVDAQLFVLRDGQEKPIKIYADELLPNDDILFDNKDNIFTINEL